MIQEAEPGAPGSAVPPPMLVLRFVGALACITIGAALVAYLFTRNRRYITFAWRVFQFAFVFLLVFLALYVLERLVLVA